MRTLPRKSPISLSGRGREMRNSKSSALSPKQTQTTQPQKPKTNKLLIIATLAFLVAFLSLWNFSWMAKARAEANPPLAIVPFFVERVEDPARGAVICPLCKGVFQRGQVMPGSENILARFIYQKMEALERFNITPVEKVKEALAPFLVKGGFEEKPIPSATRLGRELKVDFVLLGYLFRFEERIGSALGVEKPASVGYDLHLFRIKDGVEVWRGRFDETQKPLTDDLLKIGSFFRRKAQWLTAEELAMVGMDEMLKKLPETRELEGGS